MGKSILTLIRARRSARVRVTGPAMARPAAPTQNDWVSTVHTIRQLGIPRASRTAYSRHDAAVAAYSVWQVITTPMISPRMADQTAVRPALVVVIQCIRVWKEKSGLGKADKAYNRRSRSATSLALAVCLQRARMKMVWSSWMPENRVRAVFSEQNR